MPLLEEQHYRAVLDQLQRLARHMPHHLIVFPDIEIGPAIRCSLDGSGWTDGLLEIQPDKASNRKAIQAGWRNGFLANPLHHGIVLMSLMNWAALKGWHMECGHSEGAGPKHFCRVHITPGEPARPEVRAELLLEAAVRALLECVEGSAVVTPLASAARWEATSPSAPGRPVHPSLFD